MKMKRLQLDIWKLWKEKSYLYGQICSKVNRSTMYKASIRLKHKTSKIIYIHKNQLRDTQKDTKYDVKNIKHGCKGKNAELRYIWTRDHQL